MTTINDQNFLIPSYFISTDNNQIKTNRNILGHDIKTLAMNSNYLVANGTSKVCLTNIADSSTGTQTRYYAIMDFLNPNTTEQYIVFDVSASTQATEVDVQLQSAYYQELYANAISLPINSSGENTVFAPVSLNPFGVELVAGTQHPIDIALTYTGSSGQFKVNSFSLFDSPPRFRNPTDSAYQDAIACDVYSCDVDRPLFSSPGTKQNSSVAGIIRNLNAYSQSLGVKNLFSIIDAYKVNTSVDFTAVGFYGNSTTPVNYFNGLNRIQPFVFATQTSQSQTTKTCQVFVYAGVNTVGKTGSLYISSSAGNLLMTVTNSSPAWHSGTLLVPTENTLLHQYGTMPSLLDETKGNFYLSASCTTGGTVRAWTLHIFETF